MAHRVRHLLISAAWLALSCATLPAGADVYKRQTSLRRRFSARSEIGARVRD